MKKIVGLLIFFLIIFAKPALAVDTCDATQYNKSASHLVEWFKTETPKSCPSDECLNSRSDQLTKVVLECWPKGSTTQSPECWPGCTILNPAIHASLLLPGVGGQAWHCYQSAAIPGSINLPLAECPKTNCGSDGLYQYDKKSDTCVRRVNTPWDLNTTTCPGGDVGVATAIGCIPTGNMVGPSGFLSFILKFALGISGAVILFMIIMSGYTLLTSGGNPEKLQVVKENLVAIFTGLLMIAFSLILLQTIGADILRLPTF
ncbi:hypothetical protein M1403_02425 [Patescibacteria group bacterium]|nr:hypothetical protein [Patescibacteria group bacterium]